MNSWIGHVVETRSMVLTWLALMREGRKKRIL